MRRVKNQWKNSGIVQEVKRRQYFTKPMSDNMKHQQAVQQMKQKKKEEYLEKIGELKEQGFDKFGRRKDN
jgi:ribosomal protein S21